MAITTSVCAALLAAAAGAAEPNAPPASAEPAGGGWRKPLPVTFSIDYTVVTDYVWRGSNFSEFAGEGREGLNHQLGAAAEADLGRLGALGYSVWLEWYAFQDDPAFDPTADGHLQEVDHAVFWAYDLSRLNEAVPLRIEIGWIAYVFPQQPSGSDAYYTHEAYLALALNDAKLFGADKNVLNPTLSWNWDFDDFDGHWFEAGISHEFAAADVGAGDVPVLKHVAVTPSLTLGIDHRFYSTGASGGGKSSRLANLLYGLEVGFDLGSALKLPERCGALSLTGFANFSQPLSDALRRDVMDDELYGGLRVAWQW
jgi:hypothetical protein